MNGQNRILKSSGMAALIAAVAMAVLGLGVSSARAEEPIVGLWLITAKYGDTVIDNVMSGWTSDGLEFDQDTLTPPEPAVFLGYVCYGRWIKLQGRSYGLTHPFFDYDPSTGEWAGTSGYFNYTVTVSNDGKSFTGKENGKDGVPGPNPYAAGGTPFSGVTISATKIEVDKSLLP
jgi:hypothetical protein